MAMFSRIQLAGTATSQKPFVVIESMALEAGPSECDCRKRIAKQCFKLQVARPEDHLM